MAWPCHVARHELELDLRQEVNDFIIAHKQRLSVVEILEVAKLRVAMSRAILGEEFEADLWCFNKHSTRIGLDMLSRRAVLA